MKTESMTNIHPEAKLGENVEVGAFSTIEKNVEIGEGTQIGPNVVIYEGAKIGKNCQIFPGAVIAGIPQDLKFKGESTEAIIGDNTIIREFVTISRGTVDKHRTEVGSNTLLMAYVHIAHDCLIGDNCILSNNVQLGGHVHIDDWAIIGGASAVHQFVHLGEHSFVAGGSLVRKDVPPYTLAGREPLAYSGINTIGLKRRGFSSSKINELQEIYRHIYLSGHNNASALEHIEMELPPSDERDEILKFVRNSTRGIMKGYGKKEKSNHV